MTIYTGTEALREFWAELEARMTMGNRLFYIRKRRTDIPYLPHQLDEGASISQLRVLGGPDPNSLLVRF